MLFMFQLMVEEEDQGGSRQATLTSIQKKLLEIQKTDLNPDSIASLAIDRCVG